MENAIIAITLVLFVLVVLAMVRLVQDVLPYLNEEDQFCLRLNKSWISSQGTLRERIRFSRAIRNAWDQHVRLFPKSRKRVLFACLLIAAFLSMTVYPLWLALAAQ